MKRISEFIIAFSFVGIILMSAGVAFPAPDVWTWMKGPTGTGDAGTAGQQGVPDAANNPCSRSFAVTWTDAEGNLWLYGGYHSYSTTPRYYPSDLWKYDKNSGNWTWVKGSPDANQAAVYGTRSVPADENTPGVRAHAAGWTDNDGNLWLFGGQNANYDQLNDLWKYDPATNQWTWIKGSNVPGEAGHYGTRGIEAESNRPGARAHFAAWTGNDGQFWLFGGDGNFADIYNDLWRFNPETNNWTWVSGSSSSSQPGYYGTFRVASETNVPGARMQPMGWTDKAGNLWLFGGVFNYVYVNQSGHLNDLWKFDTTTNMWTWMSGSSRPDAKMSTDPETATPGSCWEASVWTDADGNFWLYAGLGYKDYYSVSHFSDLWKFDVATLKWELRDDSPTARETDYGIQGYTALYDHPGSRWGAPAWTDDTGNLWLFGGLHVNRSYNGDKSDLWVYHNTDNPPLVRYTPGSVYRSTIQNTPLTDSQMKLWLTPTTATVAYQAHENASWMSVTPAAGNLAVNQTSNAIHFDVKGLAPGTYTEKIVVECLESLNPYTTIPVTLNVIPSSLIVSPTVLDATATMGENAPADLISVSTTGSSNTLDYLISSNVPWMSASPATGKADGNMTEVHVTYDNSSLTTGVYEGNLSVSTPGVAGSQRIIKVQLSIGAEGTGTWTWMHGSHDPRAAAVFGTQGEYDPKNSPGGLIGSASWRTDDGKLWLYGGVQSSEGGSPYSSDLWNFSPQEKNGSWSWIKGSMGFYRPPVYGKKGVESSENHPGARTDAISWAGSDQTLWLYGGYRGLGDLWRYSIESGNWTWDGGTTTPFSLPTYGSKGLAAPANSPGARQFAGFCSDSNHNLWMFGGQNQSGDYRNDLWKFDAVLRQWIWISGSDQANVPGVYGNKNEKSTAVFPGGRMNAAMWADGSGKIWLFGGRGIHTSSSFGYFNDLWVYDPADQTWTWVTGSNATNALGIYGSMGVADAANTPGARSSAVTWLDQSNKLWLFGGDLQDVYKCHNDTWSFDPQTTEWVWIKGSNQFNADGAYGDRLVPTAGNMPGARFNLAFWPEPDGNLWIYGGKGYGMRTGDQGNLSDLWQFAPPDGNSRVDWNLVIKY